MEYVEDIIDQETDTQIQGGSIASLHSEIFAQLETRRQTPAFLNYLYGPGMSTT